MKIGPELQNEFIGLLFFVPVARRKVYKTKSDGSFYADYAEYRPAIYEDARGFCAYCDCHASEAGGDQQMELDHFRPRKRFSSLTNHPHNLVLACHTCNNYKHEKWPCILDDQSFDDDSGFLNPFDDSRREYFNIRADGHLLPLKPPAQYMEIELDLNRAACSSIRFRRLQRFLELAEIEFYIAKTIRAIARQPDTGSATYAELMCLLQGFLDLKKHRIDEIESYRMFIDFDGINRLINNYVASALDP